MFSNILFSLFDVLLLLGVTQGFITIGLILFKYRSQTDKVLLAMILLVFNLLCIRILSHTLHFWDSHIFRYFPLPVELAIGPLLWLYILSLVRNPFHFKIKQFIHFSPFLLSFCYGVFVYIQVLSNHDMQAKDLIAASLAFGQIRQIEDIFCFVSAGVYWYLSVRAILHYRKWLFANISITGYPTYQWLKNILVLLSFFILVFVLVTTIQYLNTGGKISFIYWQLFFSYLAILIYYLAFQGYRVTKMSDALIGERNNSITPARLKNLPVQKAADRISVKEMSIEKLATVKSQILEGLAVKELYLDPELSLQTFSDQIFASPSDISATIKIEFQTNFRNLINQYRVKKVKEKFNQDTRIQLSLLGIAYECGFNSEASFYRIFKSTEGLSPKEYINKHIKQA